jgi:WD40 repeat protein
VVRVWDAATGKVRTEFKKHRNVVYEVAAAGRRLASSDGTGSVLVWEAEGGKLLFSFAGHPPSITGLALTPEGKAVYSSDASGRVIEWDAVRGQKGREWRLPGPVLGLALASDGRRLYIANSNGTVYVLRRDGPAAGGS